MARGCTKTRRCRFWARAGMARACAKAWSSPLANGKYRQAGARVLDDKWTAVTEDGSYSAHF